MDWSLSGRRSRHKIGSRAELILSKRFMQYLSLKHFDSLGEVLFIM